MRVDSEEKKRAEKKTLSFAVCLAMVLTMLPAGSGTAWADDPPGYDQAAFGIAAAAAEKGGAAVGGLVGRNSGGTVTGSFYNRQTTGRVDTGKGEPKTSAEMVQKATFIARSWNFDAGSGIWMISEGASYPYLREPAPVSLPSPPALTGVTVTPSALTLTYGGGPAALAAVETPAGALYDVSWSSSNEDVVMVNESGVVTPVGAGTATISAVTDAGGFAGSGAVTVNKKTLTSLISATMQ